MLIRCIKLTCTEFKCKTTLLSIKFVSLFWASDPDARFNKALARNGRGGFHKINVDTFIIFFISPLVRRKDLDKIFISRYFEYGSTIKR